MSGGRNGAKAGGGKRSSQRDFEQRVISGTRCPCGKVRFLTKRDAKRAIARMKGRQGRMHAYRCDGGTEGCAEFWHVGHVPPDLIQGRATRDDVEARRFG